MRCYPLYLLCGCPFRVHSDIMESCRGKIAISYGNFSKVYLVWKNIRIEWDLKSSCLLDENKGLKNKVKYLNIWKDIKKLDLEYKEHQTENRSLKKCSSSDLENFKENQIFMCTLVKEFLGKCLHHIDFNHAILTSLKPIIRDQID